MEFSELSQRTAPLFPQAIAAEEGSQRQSLGERGSRRDVPAIGLIKMLEFHFHKNIFLPCLKGMLKYLLQRTSNFGPLNGMFKRIFVNE